MNDTAKLSPILSARIGGENGQKPFEAQGGPVAALMHSIRSAHDLASDPPPPTVFIAEPFVPEQALVLVTGPPKAGGKTTLLLRVIAAVIAGQRFLGSPTKKTPVVYCTEQPRGQFENEYLRPAGLWGSPDLHVLYAYETTPYKWPDVVTAVVQKAKEVGAGIVVFDTFSRFTRVKDEQDAALVALALVPLQDAIAQHGITIIVVHHDRKSGGEVWDAGRGSSALPGAVDLIVGVRRPEGNNRRGVRELRMEGRYSSIPPSLVIELTEDGYVSHGTAGEVAKQAEGDRVLACLPVDENEGLDLDAIRAAAGLSRRKAQDALTALVESGKADITGKGVKGNPKLYYRTGNLGDGFFLPKHLLLGGRNESDAGDPETVPRSETLARASIAA